MAYGVILGQTPKQIENPTTTATNVSYNNSQTSSIITGNNVQEAIDELFTSVSNGKELVANAITDKGVVTSATDTFATMAENIEEIATGENVYFYTVTIYSGTNILPDYENEAQYYGCVNDTKKFGSGDKCVISFYKNSTTGSNVNFYYIDLNASFSQDDIRFWQAPVSATGEFRPGIVNDSITMRIIKII